MCLHCLGARWSGRESGQCKPRTVRIEKVPVLAAGRLFASDIGINQEPFTGSADCCLMAYWSQRLSTSMLWAWQWSIGGRLSVGGHARRVAGCGRVCSKAQLSNLDKPTSLGGEDYQVIGGNPNAHVLSRL